LIAALVCAHGSFSQRWKRLGTLRSALPLALPVGLLDFRAELYIVGCATLRLPVGLVDFVAGLFGGKR